MDKFKTLFLQQVQSTWKRWKEQPDAIAHQELYRFIHSVKGTAPTIGMTDWGNEASLLLDRVDEEADQCWSSEKLWDFLAPMVQLMEGRVSEFQNESAGLEFTDIDVLPSALETDKEALILAVDDDVSMLKLVKEVLEEQGWIVLATTRADRAVEWFYSMKPDCVLLDMLLPEKDGFEVLASLHTQSELFLVPVIMISGRSDQAFRIKCYESGADDFITKPWDRAELVARVRRQLQRRKLISKLMLVDELTGAYKRIYLTQELNRQLLEFGRSRETLVTAALDVDDFQAYNTLHGYPAGDRLLQTLARLFTGKIRINDCLARDKADRFYLLLPKTDMRHAVKLLERLQDNFKKETGCTFTAALFEAEQDGVSPETCLSAANKAISEAKSSGPGSILVTSITKYEAIKNGKIHIAIIDDDSLIRKMLLKQLADVGGARLDIEIRGFRDGEEFFNDDWYKQPGKFIILLDRMMPRMNGMEVLKKLRALYDRRRFTIIMLTSISKEDEIAQAIEAGTDDYVTKPFSFVELEARIRRLIKGLGK